MWTYVVRRTLLLIPIFFIISVVVFALIHMVPGDPIDSLLGPGSTAADRVELTAAYGLDKSLPVQYVVWLKKFLTGDMGQSIIEKQPVLDMLVYNAPFTVRLGLASLFISFFVGIFLGIISSAAKNTFIDYISMIIALLGVTVPAFWLGLILMLIFSVTLGWFPVSGSGSLSALVLPAVTVGLGGAGLIARITRVSMLEMFNKDFVLLLYAKGLSKPAIIFRHIFRNALMPIITIFGLRLGWILGGAVTIEIVFSRPGVGSMLLSALYRRDYPVVQASLIALTMAVIIGAFIADIMYAYADPRVRDAYK
ncbi:MAG: ABC transporter permease [Deltaproteobacteria bacterium]|jgi:peptide/nickel transport system permease protein/oligopeptide transport system permease protein|nr:ABC transporter permease [Deltaproteobacteria bacterium]MCW9049461.1 ABC transporter permease [Deltaproteobacteria bacterium]